MDLADNQFFRVRHGGAFDQFAHATRHLSLCPDTTDGQVRLEASFFPMIAEALSFPLDLSLEPSQGVQFTLDTDPHHPRIFCMWKTANAFEGESKRRDSSRGLVQASAQTGQALAGNVAQEFEGEMDLFGADPTHRILRQTGLELSLNLFQHQDPTGFKRNRDESANLPWCGCGHWQRVRGVPAG